MTDAPADGLYVAAQAADGIGRPGIGAICACAGVIARLMASAALKANGRIMVHLLRCRNRQLQARQRRLPRRVATVSGCKRMLPMPAPARS